ncbi:uncharacterized protein LOC124409026 isoform X1 [Diprion similis]|uniref:uncharacterized protein LOC124409026 isoform X1 n=1 Tax=Diprion similis TaxID=362088 RepID=UPI001EF8C1CD|nr:uncharacterized protein LOC124409026 isoform X1 [Diprion similis]
MDVENYWAAQGLTSSIDKLNDMARFQQKQMQEKEQKMLQLYDQQQQRAYQVVKKGSAGSKDSMPQQHSITRSITTTRTTSTTQGGKVRQMFDERRQTTVKGIDRSYPLEPLENKSKKQIAANGGHIASKVNQPGTVMRKTVTVRRTAKADGNSGNTRENLTVSHHEEVSQESFRNGEQFGSMNVDGAYRDESHRATTQNGVEIEEVLDEDTVERNQMLAKIHLMEYDKNLRHRVDNDLISEKFPDDLLVNVTDKWSKKPIAKKLSQAEARLERFKNVNARRNSATSTVTTRRSESRKRSEPNSPSPKATSRIRKNVNSESPGRVSANSSTNPPSRQSLPSSPSKSPDITSKRNSASQNQRQPPPTLSPSPRPSSILSQASSRTSPTRGTHSAENPKQGMATKAKHPIRSAETVSASSTKGPPSARSGQIVGNSEALVSCKICGRRFAQDRVTLHEKICAKTTQKKRKQFDTVRHRVQGTELEPFAKKVPTTGKQAEQRGKAKKPEVKAQSNWRRKHEDFINAIRSAKQVQAHLAAGGKLSDLPPPPVSDTSDYIQCPHCGRKFNQGAADRHIPKCANMIHNKPNPRAPPKPKR